MKAIILVSSIFYLLGLKISNNIDLFKKNITSNTEVTKQIIAPDSKNNKSFVLTEKDNNVSDSNANSTRSTGSSELVAPLVNNTVE